MPKFKTRARTLDMLGRQQIAGMPTAISELFKNAHDAYADRVEIDYYRSDGLFVLRDDGVGMSYDEFVSRWLTIGTEYKLDPAGIPPGDPDKKPRPMLGEKGIGRLAIATIGPQLLVLTRPKIDNGVSDLTAAFLNWGIFEWPGIDLEEIEIPLRSFFPGTLPSVHDVAEMVGEFHENAEKVGLRVESRLLEKLAGELSQFNVDPQDIDSYLGAPSLSSDDSGTQFIIKPTSTLLAEDIDGDPTTSKAAALKKATPLKKALLGFSNTMTPESHSVIHTAFRDHKTDEVAKDLIGEDEFFTPEEFQNADHRIRGTFDQFGQFMGEISIYGETTTDHVIPWSGGRGARTNCGQFSIDFAAFEGESRYSTIPNEEHARLANKTEQYGGLYIYRNGIRVLPYGDTDYDWLDIEFRRTKSAYYYYFSHRKMFGAVEIDADRNSDLREKAGREGFQENKAYRQFRSILQNFFLQIAADFFRAEGVHAETFDTRKDELLKQDEARKRRERQVLERKRVFQDSLNEFFNKIQNNVPQKEVEALTVGVEEELRSACGIADSRLAAREVLNLERRVYADIRELESKYRVTRPRIGLSKAVLRDWNVYNSEFASLQEHLFRPTRELIDDLIGEEARKAELALDRRERTEEALAILGKEARKATGESSRAVRTEAENVASAARDAAGQSLKAVEMELRAVLSEFQRVDVAEMPDEVFVETRDELEKRIQKTTEEQSELLHSILEQLQSIDVTGESSVTDQLMAIEQRNLLLEEEAEADAQLAQLGMAIEIINHEFAGTIRSVRNGLRKLRAWADANEALAELYESIRASFDHLDGYLTLFTPLQRRLYRKEVEIRGSEVRDFLEELFRARMERHNVKLIATKSFTNAKVVGFPSSFYPVFVNLVDNAIFWLSQQNPQLYRRIELDERDGSLLVTDNGPGVNVRDREAIFEYGFSRKPGGRGMGLHIGRETLRRVGFDLQLKEGDEGATFGIVPIERE
ncbi:MAG: ATP-binding protein [Gemmatimonadota bacterium]|nr:ATP-binding protein [Gemmatimonadota bacterium]